MTEPDQGALGWRVKSLEEQTHSLRGELRRLDDKKADETDMNRLGEKVDGKADRELVADLIKRIDRQSAAIWALALAIVTAAVTFAASGGHL